MTSEDWPGDAPACSADMLFLPALARCPGRLAPGAQPVRGRSSHPIELDRVSQVANAVLWMNAVDLFHVKRHFRRRITTTVDGDASKSTPHNTTCWSTPPSRLMASRCSSSSCAARRPFSANRRPPGFRSGKHHAAKRSSGATARAVTHATGATRRTDGALFGATAHHADTPRQRQRGIPLPRETSLGGPGARRGRCAGQAEHRQGRCRAAQLPSRCPPLARHAVATRRPPRSSAGAVPKPATPRADPAIRAPRRPT